MATITLDSLNKEPKLNTVQTQPDSILASGNSIINNAMASVADNEKLAKSAYDTMSANLTKITSNQNNLVGKTAYKSEQMESTGVNKELANLDKYNQELNTINANITGLSREAQAIPLQIQEQFKNTGATDAGVAPIQTGKLRENAIKALTQASLGDIAVANITNSKIRYDTALDKANQAVDLKYKPLEDEITYLKDQIDMNKKLILDPAEKKILEGQVRILDERTRLMAEKKAEEKSINDLKIEVAKLGGNPSSLDKAKNLSQAINIATPALKNSANELIKLDNGNTVLINKLTGSIIKNIGGAKPTTGTGEAFAVTPEVIASNNGDIVSTIANIMNKSGAKKDDKLDSAVSVISGLTSLAKRVTNKKFEGASPFSFIVPNRYTTTEGRQNRSDFSALKLKTEQWASGASLSVQQTKDVLKLVPKDTDTDKQVTDKSNALANYMLTQVRGNLATQGVNVQFPTTLDLWNQGVNQDPLGLGITGGDPLGLSSVKTNSTLDFISNTIKNNFNPFGLNI